jgi:hypothetical protein
MQEQLGMHVDQQPGSTAALQGCPHNYRANLPFHTLKRPAKLFPCSLRVPLPQINAFLANQYAQDLV